jgi:anti-sigma B factor antagonist
MDIKISYMNNVGVLSIGGELDAQSSPELTRFFNDQLEEGCLHLVADLRTLEYSSSAGIRVFLGLAREMRQRGGDFRIAAVQPQVEKIFKLSKFDKIVRIFPDLEKALASFEASN